MANRWWGMRRRRIRIEVPGLVAVSYALGGASGAMFELNSFFVGTLILLGGTVVTWVAERRLGEAPDTSTQTLRRLLGEWVPGAAAPISPNFTGRDNELNAIRSALTESKIATIEGPGGAGKTQLAAEYVRRHSGDYSFVWWIRAHDESALALDFDAIAVAKSLTDDPDSRRAKVHEWLRSSNDWLLVLDDVTDKSGVLSFLSHIEGGHYLLTARERLAITPATINIEDWTREEAVLFLEGVLGAGSPDSLQKLAATLRDVPLALAQAANYIQLSGTSIEDYVRLLKQRAVDVLSAGRAFDRTDTVSTTWAISIRAAEQEAKGADELLSLCAFYSAGPIPRDLPRVAGSMNYKTILNMPSPIAARFRRKLRDDVTYNGWIAALSRHMLISVTESSIQVHPLIAQVVRMNLRNTKSRLVLHLAVEGLLEAAQRERLWVDDGSSQAGKTLLPHMLSLGEAALQTKPPITAPSNFGVRVAWYIWVSASLLLSLASAHLCGSHDQSEEGGVPAEADRASQLALQLAEKAYQPTMAFRGSGAPHSWLALSNSLEACGNIALRQGNYETAERYFKRGLAITGVRPGVMQRAGLVTGLMVAYMQQGRSEDAATLFADEWPGLDRFLPIDCHERESLLEVRSWEGQRQPSEE